MKKTLIVLLVISMLALCGCGNEAAEQAPAPSAAPEAASTATPAPTASPEPETTAGTAKLYKLPVLLGTLNRGDTVELIGDAGKGYEDYITVKSGDKYALVEKQFLRMADAAEYEAWTGYTQSAAELHGTYLRNDEKPVELAVNTEVRVIDEFDGCYLAEYEGSQYTVSKELIGRTPYHAYEDSGSVGGDYGGSVGGSDGGDIILSLAMQVEQSGTVTGKATVRLNETPLILGFYESGEEVRVLQKGETVTTLLILGMEAQTETRFIRFAGEAAYEVWTGYTASGAKLYDNPWLNGTGTAQNVNTAFEVIEDLGSCYMVRNENGEGYMAKADISKEKTYTYYDSGADSYFAGETWTGPAL